MNIKQKLTASAAGLALVATGAAGAYAFTGAASAQSTTTTPATSTAPSGAPSGAPSTGSGSSSTAPSFGQPPQGGQGRGSFDPTKGGHIGANGTKEVLLTGDNATKATAAATAAVPGGTIQRVETDAEGATYEAHVTKSDGSQVTVKMDASFKVTSIENGPA